MIGQDSRIIDAQITATKSDEVRGTVYQLLKLRAKKIGKTSLSIQWSGVAGATNYIVYGAKCGTNFVKLADTATVNYTQAQLKAGSYYKFFVIAVKNNMVMATSKTIHLATSGGKVGNTKTVKPNKKNIALKVKKSLNPTVATVTAKGKILAKKKGTCYVFAYAQDGVFAKIKVKVK